jgi:hypothetical protein
MFPDVLVGVRAQHWWRPGTADVGQGRELANYVG